MRQRKVLGRWKIRRETVLAAQESQKDDHLTCMGRGPTGTGCSGRQLPWTIPLAPTKRSTTLYGKCRPNQNGGGRFCDRTPGVFNYSVKTSENWIAIQSGSLKNRTSHLCGWDFNVAKNTSPEIETFLLGNRSLYTKARLHIQELIMHICDLCLLSQLCTLESELACFCGRYTC
jgi:hypothetical protein